MSNVVTIDSIIADGELKGYLKELVLERISVMPSGMKIAIGDSEINSSQIAQHVESEDSIGIQMMEMELEYLRALSRGELYA
jgi:hypothetical protein